MASGGVIRGWGTALPEKVLTNDDLSAMMDTNDEWITERTGIKRRHIGGTTASLSIESARKALAMSGVPLESIDGLVL
ncbi:MAG: 3-oxoacyl-ACP synthase, partial [Actinobacteria bacterium]|nr:3-oxoacyl-ACP synthase [Actinomycetota bacterium]